MTKLKCKKMFGVWYYTIEKPEKFGSCILDAPIYHLYDDNLKYVDVFGSYGDMKYYVETKEKI